MTTPLVSVICLCYNQARFVREAVESVIHQSYNKIQLIIVDDASTDGSVDEIKMLTQEHPFIELVLLETNQGNCKAFNRGLALAKGEYLIDLAADDALLPTRVETGINRLCQMGDEYGVHFSDAEWVNETGKHLGFHSDRFPHNTIPQGDIYKELIQRYFICPPTMMFTRTVIEALGGYDEALYYEDFDFWIRSSRVFKYCYSHEALVRKRVTHTAMANRQFRFFSSHSGTTFQVCEKILKLNRSKDEQQALSNRLWYEIRLNLRLLNFRIVIRYFILLIRNQRIQYAS